MLASIYIYILIQMIDKEEQNEKTRPNQMSKRVTERMSEILSTYAHSIQQAGWLLALLIIIIFFFNIYFGYI